MESHFSFNLVFLNRSGHFSLQLIADICSFAVLKAMCRFLLRFIELYEIKNFFLLCQIYYKNTINVMSEGTVTRTVAESQKLNFLTISAQ